MSQQRELPVATGIAFVALTVPIGGQAIKGLLLLQTLGRKFRQSLNFTTAKLP